MNRAATKCKGNEVIATKVRPCLTALTVKNLDASISRINTHTADADESFWNMGRELMQIVDSELWRVRTDSHGRSIYRGFSDFCDAELSFTTAHAWSCIEGARGYDTPSVFRSIGRTKAIAILRAPKEDRPQLIAKAHTMSCKTLSREITIAARRKGYFKNEKARISAEAAAKRAKGKGPRDPGPTSRVAFLETELRKIGQCLKKGNVDLALRLVSEAIGSE